MIYFQQREDLQFDERFNEYLSSIAAKSMESLGIDRIIEKAQEEFQQASAKWEVPPTKEQIVEIKRQIKERTYSYFNQQRQIAQEDKKQDDEVEKITNQMLLHSNYFKEQQAFQHQWVNFKKQMILFKSLVQRIKANKDMIAKCLEEAKINAKSISQPSIQIHYTDPVELYCSLLSQTQTQGYAVLERVQKLNQSCQKISQAIYQTSKLQKCATEIICISPYQKQEIEAFKQALQNAQKSIDKLKDKEKYEQLLQLKPIIQNCQKKLAGILTKQHLAKAKTQKLKQLVNSLTNNPGFSKKYLIKKMESGEDPDITDLMNLKGLKKEGVKKVSMTYMYKQEEIVKQDPMEGF